MGGVESRNSPIAATPGDTVTITANGFYPDEVVQLTLGYTRLDLGSATANSQGAISLTLQLPEATPGVHTLEVEENRTTHGFRLQYPGRPVEDAEYGTYLCCFEPVPDNIPYDWVEDEIDIWCLGEIFFTLSPDDDGGVLVRVIVFEGLGGRGTGDH